MSERSTLLPRLSASQLVECQRCPDAPYKILRSFAPDTLSIMKHALDAAVASLPDPVSSVPVQYLAETILRTAKEGERDSAAMQRLALMELQTTPRY